MSHDELNSDERDWSAPTHSDRKEHVCRAAGCDAVLGAHGVKFWNGWPWCAKHYREMVALAMADQDLRELEGQERASRMDIDRDDFNIARR